jgi:membrane-bound serine protease (ClpP class)
MRKFLVALGLAALLAPATAAAAPRVLAVHFDAEVNPATQGYLNHQIDRAREGGYDAVVILLDTPGGLSESMRKIVQKELSSRVPVIVYVSPEGARAASAGVWFGQSADILGMAPQTNIGSSTPIDSSGQDIGGDLHRKVVNDAAASLRALAKSHGRNAEWADSAVRKASNLTASEALAQNVVDVVAPTLPALLRTIDGRKTVPRDLVLHTAGAEVVVVHPGFLTKLLSTLIDPNILSLLFLAGIAGIGFEIFHPGIVLPGALGAVALLTAFFGFSILPVTWAAIPLIVLGVALLVIDAHVVTHGALTVSGLISLAVGLVMLFHNAPSPYQASIPFVVSITVLIGGFWAFALSKAVAVRRSPVAVGPSDIVGAVGAVRRDGQVFVRGELWRARSDEPLVPGTRVEVERLEPGLVLGVRPAPEEPVPLAPPGSAGGVDDRAERRAADRRS